MAAIDDKVHALEFDLASADSREGLHRLITEAAEQAGPEEIVLADFTETGVTGVARNQLRIQHATFSLAFADLDGGGTRVQFRIPDYLRTRETIGNTIPVSPWAAPAYGTLKRFSDHVRTVLEDGTASTVGAA